MHDHSLSWHGTGTSIKRGGVQLVKRTLIYFCVKRYIFVIEIEYLVLIIKPKCLVLLNTRIFFANIFMMESLSEQATTIYHTYTIK
jgi:hypothetical protein